MSMSKIILLTGVTLITANLTISILSEATPESGYGTIIGCLFIGLISILAGCEVFANAVECLGRRLNLSHATVGSLFAAVGTALPETSVPVVALLFGRPINREEIAIGAILGAPFMLSTLALFLLGIAVLVDRALDRRERASLNVNLRAVRFELSFFLPAIAGLLVASLVRFSLLRQALALGLILLYGVFFVTALRHEQQEGEKYTETFYLSSILGCPLRIRWIALQTLAGLVLIFSGAHLFVQYLGALSLKTGVSPLFLSLIITPVATELPEKFNSITWTLKGRDTIGLSNITGAMVFQSTVPAAVGLLFTGWRISSHEIFNILSCILMSTILLSYISMKKTLPAWLLLLGLLFYLLYIFVVATPS